MRFFYPGIGCRSEELMASGCCYTPVTKEERIEQFRKIVNEYVRVINAMIKLEEDE